MSSTNYDAWLCSCACTLAEGRGRPPVVGDARGPELLTPQDERRRANYEWAPGPTVIAGGFLWLRSISVTWRTCSRCLPSLARSAAVMCRQEVATPRHEAGRASSPSNACMRAMSSRAYLTWRRRRTRSASMTRGRVVSARISSTDCGRRGSESGRAPRRWRRTRLLRPFRDARGMRDEAAWRPCPRRGRRWSR